jgi:hypothetical protein
MGRSYWILFRRATNTTKTMNNNLIVINDIDKNRFNCVKYARSQVPQLPFGLLTFAQKKKIINSQTSKIGNVAIMACGFPWGHVGVIIGRSEGGRYKTIREANYRSGKITERTGTTESLGIVGYFDPKKKA